MSIKPIYFEKNLERQDREKVIFVEGTDDAYFLDSILEELGADPDVVGVLIVGGTGRFSPSFSLYSKSSAYRKAKGVLALRDADDNPIGSEVEIKSAFEKAFNVSVSSGELKKEKGVLYGYLVLPAAGESGDLEKMCLATVDGSALHTLATNFIAEAQKIGAFTQLHKRTAQVFLAAMPEDLCRGAGMGFRKGFFDQSHSSLDEFKAFLRGFLEG